MQKQCTWSNIINVSENTFPNDSIAIYSLYRRYVIIVEWDVQAILDAMDDKEGGYKEGWLIALAAAISCHHNFEGFLESLFLHRCEKLRPCSSILLLWWVVIFLMIGGWFQYPFESCMEVLLHRQIGKLCLFEITKNAKVRIGTITSAMKCVMSVRSCCIIRDHLSKWINVKIKALP